MEAAFARVARDLTHCPDAGRPCPPPSSQLFVGLPWPQHHAVLHNPWMLTNITLTMQAAVQARAWPEAGATAPALAEAG